MDEDDDINNNYDAEDSNNSDDDDNNLSSSLNESSLKQSKKINIETSSDANGEFHHVDGEGAQGAQPDDSLNKSSTKKGKHSKKKKGKGKKELPGLNEPGGVTAVVNKLLNKRGGGNKGAELKLEDLDENVLKDR